MKHTFNILFIDTLLFTFGVYLCFISLLIISGFDEGKKWGSILNNFGSTLASTDPVHPLKAQNRDTEAPAIKYQEERAKHLRADRAARFKLVQGTFSHFKDDI